MQSLTTYQRTQECLGNEDVDFHNDLNLQRPHAAEVLDARYDLCVAIMKDEYNVPVQDPIDVNLALFQDDFHINEENYSFISDWFREVMK